MIVSLTIMLMVVVVMIVMMLVRVITVLLVTSWWRQWWWWWCWRLWLSLRQAGCMSTEIRMEDIWLYAYILIYIQDCGCHWGKLPAWALRSAWRKAQLLIWIVLPRAANSTFDNHHGRHHRHDCHRHHHCRHHHYIIEYQWLCLPGCDVPILTGVVNPSPKMETSGRLLIHEEALHRMLLQ